MLIPVAHENLRGRRWPFVSIAIIALNFLIFFFTIGPMETEQQKSGEIQLHILVLSAHYPDAAMTPDAGQVVKMFKHDHFVIYEELATPTGNQLTHGMRTSWQMIGQTKTSMPKWPGLVRILSRVSKVR